MEEIYKCNICRKKLDTKGYMLYDSNFMKYKDRQNDAVQNQASSYHWCGAVTGQGTVGFLVMFYFFYLGAGYIIVISWWKITELHT